MRRIISAVLITILLVSCVCYAAPFSDVDGHWAADELEMAYEVGIINGDGDGRFRPDDSISRGEFVKMLAAVIANNFLQPIPEDLAESKHWASKYYVFAKSLIYTPLTEADKVGDIVPGLMSDGDMDKPIERWEMAFMTGEALSNLFYAENVASYGDAEKVAANYPAEVAQAIGICVDMGIIRGDEHGNFNPSDGATRAEAAAVMNRMYNKINGIFTSN